VGTVEISQRHSGSADVYLPFHPQRCRLQIPVEYVDLRVRDRPAYRDARRLVIQALDEIGRSECGALSWPIAIEKVLRWIVTQSSPDGPGVYDITTYNEIP